MFRKSGFSSGCLAIALSVTALGSAASPAAAFSSQFFGGVNSRIAAQFHTATAYTTIQPSQQANHIELPKSLPKIPGSAVGSATMSPEKIQLPLPKAAVSQLPVQVPVPVSAPVYVPARVATATSSVAAAAMPVIIPTCGATGTAPALAAGIDELLPNAEISRDNLTKVTELRHMIQDLSTSGKVAAARNVEEVAMYYLGYQKVWLKCGLGTFEWEQVASNDAVQSAGQRK